MKSVGMKEIVIWAFLNGDLFVMAIKNKIVCVKTACKRL
jgi:hypothetical protein